MTDPIITEILHWYNQNQYIRMGSDVSVTELMNPPQLTHLRDRHRSKITTNNLNDVIPALVGTATHGILQRYLRTEGTVSGRWLIERKLNSVINGTRVAGKFDALRDLKHLYDIKVTRVWKYIYGGITEFEEQLNMYDYMLYLDGYNIKSLTIMMVLLDWQAGKIWEKNYPKEKIMILPIKKWTRVDQKSYISQCVSKWAHCLNLPDDKLTPCTLDERWAEKEVFKLYRLPTAKRATKTFNTMVGAKSYQDVCKVNDPKPWANSIIKTFRAKPWKRCQQWCAAADFCHQYQNR